MAFIGEIRIFPYVDSNGTRPREPGGWLLCDGRSYASVGASWRFARLYGVIGTRFGGTGASNFLVPDLRDRLPVQVGKASGAGAVGSVTWTLGQAMGAAAVTLTPAQLPLHTHAFQLFTGPADAGSLGSPVAGDYLRRPLTETTGAVKAFAPSAQARAQVALNLAITTSGGSGSPPVAQPHPNCQPTMALNFFICWDGEFPKSTAP